MKGWNAALMSAKSMTQPCHRVDVAATWTSTR